MPNDTPPPKSTRKTIVLVDDHKDNLLVLSEALSQRGYEIHISTSGAAGLALAQKHRADVMIVDIVMPDMSGFEVARRAREKHGAALRLIALSGYGERNNRTRSREAGFDCYLLKPVTPDDLIPCIETSRTGRND